MMCQRMGFPPISIIGFGRTELSSEILVPKPPAKMTALIFKEFLESWVYLPNEAIISV